MRPEKQFLLDEVKEKFEQSKALIFTSYDKLGPDISWQFRTLLAESGGQFTAVKKRILLKAAEANKLTLESSQLKGHVGIVFSEEKPLEVTKSLFQFSEKNESLFEVIGAKIEGSFYASEEVKALSKLPSAPELQAQFLGLLEAPMSQTVACVESLLTSIMYCLENKK